MGASFLILSVFGGAWPFLFGEMICLVDYFNDRDFSLLNSVQHDSYFDFFLQRHCVHNARWFEAKTGMRWCFATVASFKLILCGPICVDCKYNFALGSTCVDVPPKPGPCLDAFLPNSDSYQALLFLRRDGVRVN